MNVLGFVFLTILCYANGDVYQAETCTTPDGYDGECIYYTQCPSILYQIRYARNKDFDFLRRSKCGNEKYHYCCRLVGEPECYTPDGRNGQCLDYRTNKDGLFRGYTSDWLLSSRCLEAGKICYSAEPRITESSDCKNSTAFPPTNVETCCCGVDAMSTEKIFGGFVADISEYPWLAVIQYEDADAVCSGSLISSLYVLTAAHCVHEDITGIPTAVVLGESNKTSEIDCVVKGGVRDCAPPTVTIKIERVLIHPSYNANSAAKRHDIALIRLAAQAPFTEFIRPICLPLGSQDVTLNPPANFKLKAAGWGAFDKTLKPSAVKLQVELPFVNNRECSLTYKQMNKRIYSGQICAGGETDKDSCGGDSGGPLMYENRNLGKYELLGIVSFGNGECGTAGIPGVYTNVYSYRKWIRNMIRPVKRFY